MSFAHLSGCGASFRYSCHSILESCNVFWSEVEYSVIGVIVRVNQLLQNIDVT